jgi:hypothetical protein
VRGSIGWLRRRNFVSCPCQSQIGSLPIGAAREGELKWGGLEKRSLTGDRGFESGSLHRGVRDELLIDAAPFVGASLLPSIELPEPRNFRSGPKSAAWVANEIPNEHCQSSASGYLDPDKLTVPLRELITLDRTGSTEFAVILIFCNTVRSKRVRTNCLR